MGPLKKIGLKKDWIYEVIVSTYCDNNRPNSAPMGVWTNNFHTLILEIYKNSKTLENIMRVGEFAVNLVSDVAIFYEALFNKARIAYENSPRINAPVIKNVPSVLELRLKDMTEKENSFRIESAPSHIQIEGTVKLINRARPLVLESLILATRSSYLPAPMVRETLKENCRIIRKVAPGSKYDDIIGKLVDRFGVS
jgi:hypothetical protein